MHRHTTFPLLAMACLLLVSCGKDNTCGVPYGDGAIIDLSLPEMSTLSTVGGALTINRGHKGIYVVRTSASGEFLAFECACPNDPGTAVLPADGWGSAILQCPLCKSIFSVYADGNPVEGSSTPCSLFQYSATLDPDGYHLHIY